MRHDILNQMPHTILQSVTHHLEVLSDFNAEVLRARGLEQMVGSPGRYEWEYRLVHEAQAQASRASMDAASGGRGLVGAVRSTSSTVRRSPARSR
jgi:hypothetical protein